MGLRVDGIGGYEEVDVVGVTVKTETVMMDNVTEGEKVENEEERTKH